MIKELRAFCEISDPETVTPLYGHGLYEMALRLGAEAHQGQLYGRQPYTFHTEGTAAILAAMGFPLEVQAGGLLHDTIEDTELTGPMLRAAGVPNIVLGGIVAVTFDEATATTTQLDQAKSDPVGRAIKTGDSTHNFLSTFSDPSTFDSPEHLLANARHYAANVAELADGMLSAAEIEDLVRAAYDQDRLSYPDLGLR